MDIKQTILKYKPRAKSFLLLMGNFKYHEF